MSTQEGNEKLSPKETAVQSVVKRAADLLKNEHFYYKPGFSLSFLLGLLYVRPAGPEAFFNDGFQDYAGSYASATFLREIMDTEPVVKEFVDKWMEKTEAKRNGEKLNPDALGKNRIQLMILEILKS